MDALEEIEQYIYDNNISLIYYEKIQDKSAITKDDDGYVTIAVNKRKVKSTADKVLVLTHECNHHKKHAYYNSRTMRGCKRKVEYEVKVDTVNDLVPALELKKLLKEETCRYEIAESFSVPEDFVDEAIHIYQRKGLLPYWNGVREPDMLCDSVNIKSYVPTLSPFSHTPIRPTIPERQRITGQGKIRAFDSSVYGIHNLQLKNKFDLNRITYEDYARVMRQPNIMCDMDAAEELNVTIGMLWQAREYFISQGLPIRQCYFIMDELQWYY